MVINQKKEVSEEEEEEEGTKRKAGTRTEFIVLKKPKTASGIVTGKQIGIAHV